MTSRSAGLLVGPMLLSVLTLGAQSKRSSIGREVSVPTHLQDGQEFSLPLPALLTHGLLLFNATWTEQEGGGRPLTKGTGRPLADPSRPLTGSRAFNRLSAPDAGSCAACHNAPYGIVGGGRERARLRDGMRLPAQPRRALSREAPRALSCDRSAAQSLSPTRSCTPSH